MVLADEDEAAVPCGGYETWIVETGAVEAVAAVTTTGLGELVSQPATTGANPTSSTTTALFG